MEREPQGVRPRNRRYRWPCALPFALGAGAVAFAGGTATASRPVSLRPPTLASARRPGQTYEMAQDVDIKAEVLRQQMQAGGPPVRKYELQQKRAVDIETKVLTHQIQRGVDPGLFNPLFQELNGVPRLDQVQDYHLTPAVDMVLEQFSKDIGRIQASLYKKTTLKPKQLSFEEVFNALEIALDRVEKVWGVIALIRKSWRPSPEVDELYHALSYRIATAAGILAQSEILHQALYQLLQLSEGDLSEAQYRAVRRLLWEGIQMGVEITEPDALKDLDEGNKQLGLLSTVFAENIAYDEAQFLPLRTERSEVEGLPEEALVQAAAAAAAQGHQATAEDGPWLFPSQRSVLELLQSRAEGAFLREEAFRARRRLGTSGYDDDVGGNLGVISAMLGYRRSWALTLGFFPSFADLVFESRMASREEVDALLDALRTASQAAAKTELEELQAYAAERGRGKMHAWDVAFFRRKLVQERSGFKEWALKPYLPLPDVLRGVFGLLEHLFGVVFEPATARQEVPMWHRSIRFFRLVDREMQFPFAGLYLDMFEREEKLPSTDGGFIADSFVSYSPLLGKDNVPRRPIAYIVGELPPPQKGKPTLLTFAQVRSLFNAIGRALQHLLTIQDVGLVAGTQGMELDFVDFVPKFLELWASDPDTLSLIGKHWETGEPIPDELLSGLQEAEGLHRGYELFERVAWAQLDLDLHSCKEELSEEAISELARQRLTSEELAPELRDGVEEGLSSFAGPFSTGFAAGEYASIWTEVLAADAFEAFKKATPAEVPLLGRRFRETFLEPGGGVAPLAAFRAFLGRSPKVAPLLRRLRLQRRAS